MIKSWIALKLITLGGKLLGMDSIPLASLESSGKLSLYGVIVGPADIVMSAFASAEGRFSGTSDAPSSTLN